MEITVTLKAGGGYDAPWIVLKHDSPAELRAAVMETLNYHPDGHVGADNGKKFKELSLAELTVLAGQNFGAMQGILASGGASYRPQPKTDAPKASKGRKTAPKAAPSTPMEGQATLEDAANPGEGEEVLAAIRDAKTRKELELVWATYGSQAQSNPETMKAFAEQAKKIDTKGA